MTDFASGAELGNFLCSLYGIYGPIYAHSLWLAGVRSINDLANASNIKTKSVAEAAPKPVLGKRLHLIVCTHS